MSCRISFCRGVLFFYEKVLILSIKLKIKAMQQITLNIEEKYVGTFLAFLKTLNYVKVDESELSSEQEAELAVAIEESYNPDNWVAHEDVMKRVDQWLKR
jgi:hypothetical protein